MLGGSVKKSDVESMMTLFAGFRSAYGIYVTKDAAVPGEKHKGTARTAREEVTETLWSRHLEGKESLGIITITEEGECWWGAIDVDIYNLNHKELLARIHSRNLPLVPCKSKSGGAHLMLFTSEPVPASLMQDKLTEFASSLGLSGQEIFPKQRHIDTSRDDLGSWVNMPYFNAKDTVRFAYSASTVKALTLPAFIKHANSKRITKAELKNLSPKVLVPKGTPKARTGQVASDAADFTDGPVCFQQITDQGPVPKGQRNTAMLNMGIYAKKRWPDTWEQELARMNDSYMDPPRTPEEVSATIKNLRKKDYFYNCKSQPMVSYCNPALCKTREHGIGADEMTVQVTELRKLDTDPPLWFMDIANHGTVQMSTDQLNSSIGFTKACMEQLSFRPVVNAKVWTALLGECFEKLIIIEMSEEEKVDGSISGAFESLVQEFLQRPSAETWEEILLRKPYTNGEAVYFRLDDLMQWIGKKGFRDYGRHQAINALRQMGAVHQRQRKLAHNRVVRLWSMPIVWAEEE